MLKAEEMADAEDVAGESLSEVAVEVAVTEGKAEDE